MVATPKPTKSEWVEGREPPDPPDARSFDARLADGAQENRGPAAERAELKRRLRHFWETTEVYWETLSSEEPTTSRNRERATSFIPDGSTVLDVACGTAANSRWIQGRCRYFGTDLSLTNLTKARQRGLRLVCGDADELPFGDGTFDAAIATYVLEHAVHPVRMLREICRVVRADGRMVLLGPGWDFPFWYPNSLRSKAQNKSWRLQYTLQRLQGQLRAWCFGQLPFYAVAEPDALHSEFIYDADAVYVVWAYEVVEQMKRWGCRLTHGEVDDRLLGSNPAVRWGKRLLTALSPYRYAGSTVLLVFER